MKKKKISSKIIETYNIDYQNGIQCVYTTENNVLTYYSFKNDEKLTYIDKNTIDTVLNQLWYDRTYKKELFKTVEELEKFDLFDDLYYVQENFIFDKNKTPLSTPIKLDAIFFHCYPKIETSEKKCQEYLDNLKKEFILSSEIEYIPYYNQNDDKKNHYTISLVAKIPQEDYVNVYNNLKNQKLTNDLQQGILGFLKK